MMQNLLENDPIKEALEAFGLTLTPFRLSANSAQLGWSFDVNNATFVYRWEGETEVIIIEYRQNKNQTGMRNPFVEFVWFLNFLADPKFNLTNHQRGSTPPRTRRRFIRRPRSRSYYTLL